MLTVRYKTEIIYERIYWMESKKAELRPKFDADLSEVRDSESIEKLRVSYLGQKAPSLSF